MNQSTSRLNLTKPTTFGKPDETIGKRQYETEREKLQF